MRSIARASLAAAGALALVAATPGCPSQKRSFSREVLMRGLAELPRHRPERVLSAEELSAARVPTPPEVPAALLEREPESALERARLAVALRGDLEEAGRAWARLGPEDVEGLAHRCLVAESDQRGAEMLASCGGFLDAAPKDARAAAALAALERARPLLGDLDALVLNAAPRWLEGCRAGGGKCADLAFLLSRLERQAAASAQDLSRAAAASDRLGALREAVVAGPFVGDAVYAFARAGAGRRLERGPRFSSRERSPWDGVFRPSLRGDAGLYRLSFEGHVEGGVQGDAARTATLFARSSYAMRVYVDGQLALERNPQLQDEPATSRVSLALSPGAHKVEAVVVSHGATDGIELALLDKGGAPAFSSREARGDPAGAEVLDAPPLLVLPGGGAPALARLDALLWRHHLGAVGHGIAPGVHLEHARELVREHGYATQALVAAASAFEGAPRLPSSVAAADAAPLYARVLSRWPAHPGALRAKAERHRDDRPREALAVYRELAAGRPEHPLGHAGVAELALELGLAREALAASRALLALTPPPLDRRAAGTVLERFGFLPEAAAVHLEDARREGVGSSAFAEALLEAGRRDEATLELTRLLELEPAHAARDVAFDLLELEDPSLALAAVEAALVAQPADRTAVRRRLQLLSLVQGPAAALVQTRAAVERHGADRGLYALLEELGAAPLFAERLEAGDRALDALRAGEAHPFPGRALVLVVDHDERWLMPDLSSVRLKHWIVELGSEEALDQFGELSFSPQERVVRLRMVKPDGSERLPERRAGVDDVSLTGLAVGDLVEVMTLTFNDGPTGARFAHELVPLWLPAPVLERSVVFHLPRALLDDGLRLVAQNGAPDPEVVSEEGGHVRFTYRTQEVDSWPNEPHATEDAEALPTVGYLAHVDDELFRMLRGTATLRDAAPDPFLTRVALLVTGDGTPRERWQRLFRFVATRIEHASAPSTAMAVLAEGRGRRGPLLVALARAARLDARPVALHPEAAASLTLPVAHAYPLLGVAVRLGDRESFAVVDGGLAVLDALPPAARGARVLDLSLAPSAADTLPDDAIASEPVRVQLDLRHEGEALEGFLALTVPAPLAEPLRRLLESAEPSEVRAALEQALSPSLPGCEVREVTASNLAAPGRPLGLGVSLAVPLGGGGLEPVRFEHLFPYGAATSFGLAPSLASYLQTAERRRPLLVHAAHEVLEVQLVLPKEAAFTEVPDSVQAEAGPFTLQQRVEVTDGGLYFSRELRRDTARIDPAAWRLLRASLTDLANRTDARLAFVLPAKERSPDATGLEEPQASGALDVGR